MKDMDDEPEEMTCPDCDFRFSVIWSLNAEIAGLPEGTRVIEYCPHCGAELEVW
jgi:DNA-directed RNA polymerase subunit RPC12/RpoP